MLAFDALLEGNAELAKQLLGGVTSSAEKIKPPFLALDGVADDSALTVDTPEPGSPVEPTPPARQTSTGLLVQDNKPEAKSPRGSPRPKAKGSHNSSFTR